MSQLIGQKYRLEINTGTSGTPAWKKFKHEVTFDISHSADKVETSSKDTGKHKDYIKTLLDSTVNCTAREDTAPGSGFVSYTDVYGYWLNTHADANGGKYGMRIFTDEEGGYTLEFDGFFESIGNKYENNGLVEYTFSLQIVTLPELTPVA